MRSFTLMMTGRRRRVRTARRRVTVLMAMRAMRATMADWATAVAASRAMTTRLLE
jgi:hypothetical protein